MKEHTIFQIAHIYRDDFRIRAFTFGQGDKSLCILGSSRGNEYQQIFMCSRILRRLKRWEAEGRIAEGHEIMVIPSANPASMNIGKRFWGIDNTDINRMFPGYHLGETTQRIAAGLFDVINKYRIGVHFTSFYMPGEFLPHVQMIRTGYEKPEMAKDFGLPYIVLRDPRPYDTTTLNYNWQIWETDAFSIYSGTTTRISMTGAEIVADAMERFMTRQGILTEPNGATARAGAPVSAGTSETSATARASAPAGTSRIFHYDDLHNIRTTQAGLYRSLIRKNMRAADEEPLARQQPENNTYTFTGQPLTEDSARVTTGQPLAEIIDPCTGDTLETLTSPTDGVIFFQYNDPLIYAHTSAVKILAD